MVVGTDGTEGRRVLACSKLRAKRMAGILYGLRLYGRKVILYGMKEIKKIFEERIYLEIYTQKKSQGIFSPQTIIFDGIQCGLSSHWLLKPGISGDVP